MVQQNKTKQVYRNEFDSCRYSSIKVNESPQLICENTVIEADSSDVNDDTLVSIRVRIRVSICRVVKG